MRQSSSQRIVVAMLAVGMLALPFALQAQSLTEFHNMSAEEKRRVAFHESGHTLVARSVPTGEPVHKVSIIPRGVAALGYTLQLPVAEKFLSTENELKDQLAVLLGGRVAEELAFGDVSSGASNDLERASEIARVSSLTTMTTASLTSLSPIAARCRIPST